MLRKRKSVRKLFGSFFGKKLTSSIFDVVLNVAVSTYRRQQPFADSFFKISQNSQENTCVMMNCFCGMVDRRKAFSLISYLDHCQRSSPSWISEKPRAGACAEPEYRLWWVKSSSSDNHYTNASCLQLYYKRDSNTFVYLWILRNF